MKYSLQTRLVAVALLFVATLSSCGHFSKVSMNPQMRQRAQRVAVMPFEVHGIPNIATDEALSDHLATALIESGLGVVDRQAVSAEAKHLGIDLAAPLSGDALTQLASALKVDGFFMGTVNYRYEGPSAGTTPIDISTTTDRKGNVKGVNVSGGGSYSNSGGYYVVDMSARLVSAKDFETLLSAYTPGYRDIDMVEAIQDKISK